MIFRLFIVLLSVLVAQPALAQPTSFRQAKLELRKQVYHDQNQSTDGSLYCGCNWQWVGASGGRVDLASCGYVVRKQQTRAERIEWEHVVPAWVMGHQRQCWQKGGRRECAASDPLFRVMEADMHNLAPAIGEVNADRSNYSFGVLPGTQPQHGKCEVRVAFDQRAVEPRDAVKGQIARTYFYIHDRYNLRMSRQQQQLLMAWDRQFPVSQWERERDRRIAAIMGHHNPFVTGERSWALGHRNLAEGVRAVDPLPDTVSVTQQVKVLGNTRSNVYHLSEGCPSYNRVSEANRIYFQSSQEAEAAGYRKAGNCI
ncbi:endonuclease [Marinobacter sp. X15-166B]|uniref:endonuclease n=1 Tax=Marinobacter sp. X15-166B TaxID=1897620 RepID=UPI00085C2B2F|nr:endonuclease [Marinobacter sp. X15-166B]OEY67584.1 deoxyribonuclease I [Marinobacter sp. X15-166B]